MEFVPRFFKPCLQTFFLFGPRGTGKSTWLKRSFPGALRVDLLDPGVHRTLQARPERLIELVRGNTEASVVVIDEVQKVPELLPVVQLLLESGTTQQFVMTGSSARKLKRGAANLLGGRAVVRRMHPFMLAEWNRDFELDQILLTGLVPLVVSSPEPSDVLKAYVGLYIQEEVQGEALTRNIGAFARFLEASSFSHASLLSISELSRECQVERKTVESYLSILEDLLLAFRLPVFTRRAKRAVVAHQKFYFFDAGVFASLRPRGPLDSPQEIHGAALEGLVAQHLRAWIDNGGRDSTLSYWRTRSGLEVDFVLYGPNEFVALEVKNSAAVRPKDLKGLKAFRDEYPEARPVLLYRGADRLLVDDIICLPCDTFLRGLRPDQELLAGIGSSNR